MTDSKGVATVSFDVSDSVTTFRAMADAVSYGGYFGKTDTLITTQLPTYADVKVCAVYSSVHSCSIMMR